MNCPNPTSPVAARHPLLKSGEGNPCYTLFLLPLMGEGARRADEGLRGYLFAQRCELPRQQYIVGRVQRANAPKIIR